jgi:hypothetical protein
LDLSLLCGSTFWKEETWIVGCFWSSVSALDRITNHSVVLVDAHAHDAADTAVHSLVAAADVVDVAVVDVVVHAHMAVDIVLPLPLVAAADLPHVR